MTNARYRNIYLDNHYHFCTCTIVDRQPFLSDQETCLMILRIWASIGCDMRSRYVGS